MWTRFDHIDEVPTGLPLMYLTLLTLEYMDIPRIRPTGMTVLDMAREADNWINDALYTRIADRLDMSVETEGSTVSAVARHGAHRVSVLYPNRNVAIARCAITLLLTPMHLVVPTELVTSYTQWKYQLAQDVGFRAAMSGKTNAMMAYLQMGGPLDAMIALAEQDEKAPPAFVQRLKDERTDIRDVVVVGGGQGFGHLDIPESPLAGVREGRGMSGTPIRPRTRVGLIGAGPQLSSQLMVLLKDSDIDVEVVQVDEDLKRAQQLNAYFQSDERFNDRSVFADSVTSIMPERQFGCPYLGTGGGGTHPYLPVGHAKKVKAKRRASKRARKQNRRNK